MSLHNQDNENIQKKFEKIVVFEKINTSIKPLVKKYLNEGFLIYYFNLKKNVLKDKKLIRGIEEQKIVNLSTIFFYSVSYFDACVFAQRFLDKFFLKYYADSLSIKTTANLYGSDEIYYMYKKDFLLSLNKMFDNLIRIREISKSTGSKILFYPEENTKLYDEVADCLDTNLKIIPYTSMRTKIAQMKKRGREIAFLFYPWYILFKKAKLVPIPKKHREQYLVSINANLPSLLQSNYHFIEFLVDERFGVSKDQIVFIDDTKDGVFSKDIEKQGYPVFNFFHNRQKLSLSFYKKVLTHFFPVWLKCLIYSFSDDAILIETNRKILTDYVKWNIFFDYYELKKSVTILLPDNLSKSLIFSQKNCKTFYIYPDNSAPDYVSGYDEKIPISMLYTFMKYDCAIVFGNKIVRYFSNNRNRINMYYPLGVPAAQIIREIKEGTKATALPSLMREKKLSGIIIGVFDNSYVDYGHVKVKDGVRFGNEILTLLDEMPEISIIFKEKKHRSVTPALIPVYERLEKHPRCLMIKKTEKDCIFSTDVIAASNMIVSVGYTSTNAEALSAGIKAIYYDVTGTDIGNQYYFNNYPRFVAHNYGELIRLIRYWLFECSERDFNTFLNNYVKGEIDPYLDMKAIDRLQMLLKEE